MRRCRSELDDKERERIELRFSALERRSVLHPCRKKRRTFLESLQAMSIKNSCDSSFDGNSSCATGGTINATNNEADYESLDDEDGDGDNENQDSEVLLSDQEKVHRRIMYQLATGNASQDARTDVVTDRLENMIRLSRLRAAKDDICVPHCRESKDEMNVECYPSGTVRRSNSLPQRLSDDLEPNEPPMESIEVEMIRR
jgi:hypothetical protein